MVIALRERSSGSLNVGSLSLSALPQIADFGLSRDLAEGDYYRSRGGKIPIKWTAPEALHYHKYSTSSDVWSYGMVLFEIWSLGHKPFEDLSVTQVSILKGQLSNCELE